MKHDIIIVGAGIFGAVLFFELSNAGHRVLLLEKNTAASGTTALGGGLVYQLSENQALQYSVDYYQQFKARTGISIDTKQVGLRMYKNSQMTLDPEAFCIEPIGVVNAWITAGQIKGGEYKAHATVTEVLSKDKTVCGVLLEGEQPIFAKQVILACGVGVLNFTPSPGQAASDVLDRAFRQGERSLIGRDRGTRITRTMGEGRKFIPSLTKKAFQYNRYQPLKSTVTAVIDIDRDFYLVPSITQGAIAGLLFQDKTLRNDELPKVVPSLAEQINAKMMNVHHRADLIEQSVTVDVFTQNERPGLFATEINNLWLATGGSGYGIKYAPYLASIVGTGLYVHLMGIAAENRANTRVCPYRK